MVSIPGIAYLIIGALIAVYSRFVISSSEDNPLSMQIFFYIGLALITIGVFKLILKIIHRPEKEHKEHTRNHHHYKTHPAQHSHPAHQQHKIIYCPGCGTKNYSSSNFCHKCGKGLH